MRFILAAVLLAGWTVPQVNRATAQPPAKSEKKKETEHDRITRMVTAGRTKVVVKDHTRDACSKNCTLVFTSTTDGDVEVKPGETKYFKINKRDDYTRSGGYYWKCCNAQERSRLNGATYIMVVRKADTGAFDQYRIELESKN